MINQKRVERVFAYLNAHNLKQFLISDPLSIFYLTGRYIDPGERFLGLILALDKEPVLVLSSLFRFKENIGVKKVYFLDGDNLLTLLKPHIDENEALGVDKNLAAHFLLPLIKAKLANNFSVASLAIDNARAVKDESEIAKMRLSSAINDKAMAKFRSLIKPSISEIEVAESCLKIYKDLGASGYSFSPIVAFGKNAADPHHEPDNTILKEGDTILFDVGCKVGDYCSDMTRVFYYKKKPSPLTQKIYNLVRLANEEAQAMLKPNISIASIDKKARDIITSGGYGNDFTHRLGHFIGLETHDFGDISQANKGFTAVGNTFSIEPGIYNLESGIGVRIEDIVLITANGYESLNKYSHDWEVIE